MIPAKRSHLFVTAVTHPGMKRKNNEDRYAVSAYEISAENHTPSVLAVISDGIGGHRAGEVAAEIAVETISQVMAGSDARQPITTLQSALLHTSQIIRAQAESDFRQKGMGATCACAWVIGDSLYTVHLGDSRIYLIRNRNIYRLTVDHTWIQEALEYGALTPEQAERHPNSHVIRRYLGSKNPVDPDFRMKLDPSETDDQSRANQGMRLLPGDQLILCSDGLTDLVDDGSILVEITSNPLEEALNRLVSLANQRGGHDNITIVGLEVPKTGRGWEHESKRGAHKKSRRNTLILAISGMTIIAILGMVMLGWYFFADRSRSLPIQTQSSDTPMVGTSTEIPGLFSPKGASATVSFTTTPTRPGSPTPTFTAWPTNTPEVLTSTPSPTPQTPTVEGTTSQPSSIPTTQTAP